MNTSDSASTVEKAMDMLLAMAREERPMTVREIAGRAEVSTTSAYRILAALESRGACRRLTDGRHVLGGRLLELAESVDFYPLLRVAAAAPMYEVRSGCGVESVGLYIRLNSADMTCIEVLPGLRPIRHVERPHQVIPVSRGAVSLVFLASDVDRYGVDAVRHHLAALPDAARPHHVDETLERIERTRASGIAESRGDRLLGAAGLAVPVRAVGRTPTAVLSLSGPAERFTDYTVRRWSTILVEGAAKIATAFAESLARS